VALYLGEAVRIKTSAVDPETKLALDPPPGEAFVDFWLPGKSPTKNAVERATPDLSNQAMTYRAATADFILFQATESALWVAGKWTYRVTVVGTSFRNWEYATFALKP
jgi:hypothetical protein